MGRNGFALDGLKQTARRGERGRYPVRPADRAGEHGSASGNDQQVGDADRGTAGAAGLHSDERAVTLRRGHTARAAAAAGIPIVINCDAHRVGGFEVARYGIASARRGWLSADAVANTQPWSELARLRPRAQARA